VRRLSHKWWGPDGCSCPYATIDVRKGGLFVYAIQGPPEWGVQLSYGNWAYEEVIPLKRFAIIHNLCDREGRNIDPTSIGMPADFPQDIRMEFDFKSLEDGKTEVSVVERDWPLGRMRDMAKQGMEQTLVKLDALLKSGVTSA
jgi:uncharacterized protein YndB with AHSA1/START domain